ncbi:MAG: caspase family protein [Deltaproteobacteria bacterium]|nr:caspase family protein [Deltaproteobacteria bacterium]
MNASNVSRYAIIVANNNSLDEGVPPLRYADDDGARYFEMFTSAGVEVSLLTVLGAEEQRRYIEAAKAAVPPSYKNLRATLKTLFTRMESAVQSGSEVHFYFIYAGHGDVGANQEGYLNLLDHRFTRSELYSEIVAQSPASFNHIILDACHAYYMVNKRGGGNDKSGDYKMHVRDFLEKEMLTRYPNTGVILAASNESETHEWQRFESGIFSHEIRSAMVGAGDVNNDGFISYSEAAACVDAANAAIDVPNARLKVFFRPPQQKVDVPLLGISDFKKAPTLNMPISFAGKYYVEDARGVRLADLHYSTEQPVVLKLVGKAPFYIRTAKNDEAMVGADVLQIELSSLQFVASQNGHRGSVEETFRKKLFSLPFGQGFYRGVMAQRQESGDASLQRDDTADERPEPGMQLAKVDTSAAKVETASPSVTTVEVVRPADLPVDKRLVFQRRMGVLSLGSGLVFGVMGTVFYGMGRSEWHDYKKATALDDIKTHRDSSEKLLTASRVFWATGAGLAVLGGALLIRQRIVQRKMRKRVTAQNAVQFHWMGNGALFPGVTGTF